MTPNVLADLNFGRILSEATASTQTGKDVLTKFQTHLMTNAVSCGVVNQFVKEAAQHGYDNGLHEALAQVSDYIQGNKVSWALASACESILANERSFNMLNRNAAHQVEKLLEQKEEDVVRYIRAGALKNVMFCESFRNIAKGVFSEQTTVEYKADYTKRTPCSITESVGDGYCFVIAGQLYKADGDGHISEANWNEVSNTFRTVASLLNANCTKIDGSVVTVHYMDSDFVVENSGVVTRKVRGEERTFQIDGFREYSNMVVATANPRRRQEVAAMMEAIALLSEHYDSLTTMDNAGIYTTATDQFLVIESGNDLYATLLASYRQPKWTINEDAIRALSFIKSKTNTELGEEYKDLVEATLEMESAEHQQEIKEQLEQREEASIKARIAALTEKFAHDPAKLAVLAKLAAETQDL